MFESIGCVKALFPEIYDYGQGQNRTATDIGFHDLIKTGPVYTLVLTDRRTGRDSLLPAWAGSGDFGRVAVCSVKGRLPLLTTALGDRLVLPRKRLFKGCEIQRHDLLESAKTGSLPTQK